MNQLLISIANRIVFKAIKVNTEKYNIQVAYKFINNKDAIVVVIFNEHNYNQSHWFYDDEFYSNKHHINHFRYILKKIRKREL